MIKIGKKLAISSRLRTLIIAEISANHCGSKKSFLKHILAAHKFGADLIKIQTYEPQDMVLKKNFTIKEGLWKKSNLWNLYRKAQTPFDWHYDAFKLAKKYKFELFSTPFSVRAVNFLKKFKPNLYKISSFEITDHNLITEIAKTKKPIILSTGMSSIKEIKSALKIIKKYHNKIIVLYCVSGYPTPLKDINFNKIKEIKKKLKLKHIGFSDHTHGIDASIMSLNYGVNIIERHFTINKKSSSPDVKFSIGVDELKNLKKFTISYKIVNDGKKSQPISEKSSQIFRRSIFATKDIKKDDIFSSENIGCYRPNIGLSSNQYFKILGKKSRKKIKKGDALKRL
jgi:pseudaminic acid synthase